MYNINVGKSTNGKKVVVALSRILLQSDFLPKKNFFGVKMKIAIICDILGKKNNGTTVASYNLINAMRAKGHEVVVVCCDFDHSENCEGFVVLDKLNLGPLNRIVKRNGVSLPIQDKRQLAQVVKSCDIVHVMVPFHMGVQACKIAKKLGKPVTAGFHCQAELISSHLGLMNFGFANRAIYKMFYEHLYQHTDAIHYPTQFIRDDFENVVGQTKGVVISNGVNKSMTVLKSKKPDEYKGKFVILSIGRLCKEKAHSVLIEAAKLSKRSDDLQLIFAGQGPLLEKLKRQARSLKNPPEFRYFARDELVQVLNWSDLYCHPAKAELEGIACLEAIACGLVPVVSDSERSATKSFALTENNLFENENAADLAKKIDFWIEHPEEKAECRKKYLNFSKNFKQDDCMAQMEQMFLHVLENRLK